MCGGYLKVEDGESIAICEYCNSKQTLPKTRDEIVKNLYNRANNLRLKCEFDKASDIYEKIIEQDDNEAEAHWGNVLCKYGIEYVDDSFLNWGDRIVLVADAVKDNEGNYWGEIEQGYIRIEYNNGEIWASLYEQ